MKKNKLFVVALVAALMIVGLVMASCRIGCEGAGDCEVSNGKGSFCTTKGCSATKAAFGGFLFATGSGKCDC